MILLRLRTYYIAMHYSDALRLRPALAGPKHGVPWRSGREPPLGGERVAQRSGARDHRLSNHPQSA